MESTARNAGEPSSRKLRKPFLAAVLVGTVLVATPLLIMDMKDSVAKTSKTDTSLDDSPLNPPSNAEPSGLKLSTKVPSPSPKKEKEQPLQKKETSQPEKKAPAKKGLTAPAAPPVQTTAVAAGTSQFLNQKTRNCLAVPNASTANGANVIQWTCGNTNTPGDQQWETLATANSTQVMLRNKQSGKCLAIPGGDSVNAMQAIQWTCTGGKEQIWAMDSLSRLRNVATNKCLAIGNGNTAAGAPAIQWTCLGSTDQRWSAIR